jgi:hypothetical protein
MRPFAALYYQTLNLGSSLISQTLCLAGAADTVGGIYRTAIVQTATPPNMMGRLHGLESTVVATAPSLGDVEAAAYLVDQRPVFDRVRRCRVHAGSRRNGVEDAGFRSIPSHPLAGTRSRITPEGVDFSHFG